MKFRSERERVMVVWGSIVGSLLLWFSLLIQPALKDIRDLKYRLIPRSYDNLEEARKLAGELQSLGKQPKAPQQGSMSTVITNIVRQQLKIPENHVVGIRETGKVVEVKLSSIDPATLMRLLHALETARIRPEGLTMTSFGKERVWDVTFTVSGK